MNAHLQAIVETQLSTMDVRTRRVDLFVNVSDHL